MKLLILNGTKLNLLGSREPAIYGPESYDALCQQIQRHAAAIGCTVTLLQSNHEGGADRRHSGGAGRIRRHRHQPRRLRPLQLRHL